MYPVNLGYSEAVTRIRGLLRNGHYAEALVTSMFTVEKTFRRTLKQLIVSAGFESKHANILLEKMYIRGMKDLKELWVCFDPRNRTLPNIIGNNHWQAITTGQSMRNRLVHGIQVYKLSECEAQAEKILTALEATITAFDQHYGFNGWTKVTVRRRSVLHTNPKVNT